MLDPRHIKPILRQLEGSGGSDIAITPHGVYEISMRKLDEETVEQAIRNIIEKEKPHDPESA